jgi:rubrerythrin
VAKSMSEREIIEMAMAMEEIARDFYGALALGSDDPQVGSFCIRASREEAKHFGVLNLLRDTWMAASAGMDAHRLDEDDECVQLAKEQILPDPVAVHGVAVGGDLDAAFETAIQMETDSIRFYQGLIKVLPRAEKALGAIVGQEMNHLWHLQNLRGQARAA